MGEAARLLFPAVRWDARAGDWDVRGHLDRYAALGVGGYILFGGPAPAVAELTVELRARSEHPVLVGADLERGAGQQFEGATPLPPAGALAALDDPAVTRRAGELTGREAVALGLDWVFAPVADLDVEPENPIIGSRAFGADPERAARHVAAWVAGCRDGGAMACAKHFPGHGRTTADSHLTLPRVDADRDTLNAELAPFRAAVEAGVDSVMTAHVAFPALDPDGVPATLSAPILRGVLRGELAFDGLVVTDALIMAGARAGDSPESAAVRAVAAGCDALLYPEDVAAVAEALEAAPGDTLAPALLEAAVARVRAAAESRTAREPDPAAVGRVDDRAWALATATRAVRTLRGEPRAAETVELVTVDDDLGGPHPPPSRSRLPSTLAKAGVSVMDVDEPGGATLVAVYADIRGFKGRAGLSEEGLAAVRRAVSASSSSVVALFGHPRLAEGLPGDALLCAWGGEPLMQEAAAVRLVEGWGP